MYVYDWSGYALRDPTVQTQEILSTWLTPKTRRVGYTHTWRKITLLGVEYDVCPQCMVYIRVTADDQQILRK